MYIKFPSSRNHFIQHVSIVRQLNLSSLTATELHAWVQRQRFGQHVQILFGEVPARQTQGVLCFLIEDLRLEVENRLGVPPVGEDQLLRGHPRLEDVRRHGRLSTILWPRSCVVDSYVGLRPASHWTSATPRRTSHAACRACGSPLAAPWSIPATSYPPVI